MLYYVNSPNFIDRLLLLFEISANMFLEITYFPACDATNFESNIGFFVKEFYYMTEKSGKKFKYFKNTKNF